MDKDELWSQALAILLDNVDADDPRSVFLHLLAPFDSFGDYLILLAENAQVESWVNKNYLEDIQAAVAQVTGTPFTIRVKARTALDAAPQQTAAPAPAMQQAQAYPEQQASPQHSQHPETPWDSIVVQPPQPPQREQTAAQAAQQPEQPEWMNTFVNPADLPSPRAKAAAQAAAQAPHPAQPAPEPVEAGREALFQKCTFETFVVGKSNEFARATALAVAERPGKGYNPLFIYGDSGLGKTHLLVAIANYTRQNYPYLVTRYAPASDFLADYVAGVEAHQFDAFDQKYRHVDILLIDDVQYLEGKGETINQLFDILNMMTNNNKQIVLSADRSPKDIELDERMRSRFMMGLLADIKPPDYETRLAILRAHLAKVEETMSLYAVFPDEVLNYLADTATSNVREMEGAINRLASYMALGKRTQITVDEAKEVLQDFFPDKKNKQVSIDLIQNEVERFFDVSHEDMVSSKRAKTITYPRHIAIYLARYMTEESLEAIGKKFGGRDHTTVMHSVNKIEKDQKENRTLYDHIEKLTVRINERG